MLVSVHYVNACTTRTDTLASKEQIRQRLRVDSAKESVYNIKVCRQRELARIYSLNRRLISRLLVKSVREESNQALVVRLLHAAQDAESVGITQVRAKKML
jgi:hypothetical protein